MWSIASVYACRNALGGQHAVAGQAAPEVVLNKLMLLMMRAVAQDG